TQRMLATFTISSSLWPTMDRSLPLSGLRILDCSRVLAGPFATMLLADLGADVIKLEPPAGDESRGWGPPWWGDPTERRSAYFASVNRNKRDIVVDLRTDAGQALLDRLAAGADLLVHNALPSSASRLGLDAARLRGAHPGLVVAAVGGFAGRDSELPAYDLLAQAMSGLMSVTGEPSGPPQKVGVALLDLLAGLELAVGALAALLGRARDGHSAAAPAVESLLGRAAGVGAPPAVDVSLMEASVASLTNVLANHLATGQEPRRWGNEHPNIVPYQVFAARDGHLAIAVGNDAQFTRFAAELGVAVERAWSTNAGRVADRDEVVARLAAAVEGRGRDELVAALRAADVPAGPVAGVGEALRAIEAAGDGAWLQAAGEMRLAPDPIRLDGERLPLRREPPLMGEHTDEVLTELGMDSAAIRALRMTGVVA
ncbi:MAG TPA: CoA transferase, partial [Candidatus Limnocylindrales bacterium]|nr:CoA transferase [Candidatus Limnocylindrales bacterium]